LKRPIYFSPGSFGDDDYQWMKDYLELKVVFTNWFLWKNKYKEENYPDMGQIRR
jgi:hypothetical protein